MSLSVRSLWSSDRLASRHPFGDDGHVRADQRAGPQSSHAARAAPDHAPDNGQPEPSERPSTRRRAPPTVRYRRSGFTSPLANSVLRALRRDRRLGVGRGQPPVGRRAAHPGVHARLGLRRRLARRALIHRPSVAVSSERDVAGRVKAEGVVTTRLLASNSSAGGLAESHGRAWLVRRLCLYADLRTGWAA